MQALPPQNPGVYPGSSQASLLRANEQQYLFQNQAIPAGQSSIAVQLERIKSSSYPFGVSVQIQFSADPGTFRVDVQDADLDTDASYVTMNSITAGLNSSFVGRLELPSLWTKYLRVQLVTRTNVVNTSVLVTR